MRTATALALAALLALAFAPSASGQSTASPPPFAAGPAKLYAHATADSLTVWMNALVDDGGAAPYYLYGAPAVASQAGQTPALEPVANQAF